MEEEITPIDFLIAEVNFLLFKLEIRDIHFPDENVDQFQFKKKVRKIRKNRLKESLRKLIILIRYFNRPRDNEQINYWEKNFLP